MIKEPQNRKIVGRILVILCVILFISMFCVLITSVPTSLMLIYFFGLNAYILLKKEEDTQVQWWKKVIFYSVEVLLCIIVSFVVTWLIDEREAGLLTLIVYPILVIIVTLIFPAKKFYFWLSRKKIQLRVHKDGNERHPEIIRNIDENKSKDIHSSRIEIVKENDVERGEEKEYSSLYEELCDKCNPQNYMNPYNKEKVRIANELFANIKGCTEEDETKLNILRKQAHELLGVRFSTRYLYEFLLSYCNPALYFNLEPYPREQIDKANDYYNKILVNKYDVFALEQIKEETKDLLEWKMSISNSNKDNDDDNNNNKELVDTENANIALPVNEFEHKQKRLGGYIVLILVLILELYHYFDSPQISNGSEAKENPPQENFYYYGEKKLTPQRSYNPLFHRPYTVMTDEKGNEYKFEKKSMDMFNEDVDAVPMFRDVSILPNSDGIDISGYNPSWWSQLGNLTEEGWETTPLVKNMTLEEYYDKHPEYRPLYKKGDKLIVEDSEGDMHVMRIDGMDVNGAYSNKGSNGRAFMPGKWHTNDIENYNTTDPMAMLGYRLSEVGESWDAKGTVVHSPKFKAINKYSQIGSIKKSGTPFTFGLNGQVVLPYQEANQDSNILSIGSDGVLLPPITIEAQKKYVDAINNAKNTKEFDNLSKSKEYDNRIKNMYKNLLSEKKFLAELDKEGLTKDEFESLIEKNPELAQQYKDQVDSVFDKIAQIELNKFNEELQAKTTTRKQTVKPQNIQQQNNTDNTPKVMSFRESTAKLFKHSRGGENLKKYSVRGEVDEGEK